MPNGSSGSVKIFYPPYSREDVVRRLRAAVHELDRQMPLCEVVLFGSYATGRFTVGSDVDLLVIYRGQPREDAFLLAKRILALPRLEPHVYAEGEADMLRDSLARMARDGIRIHPPDADAPVA